MRLCMQSQSQSAYGRFGPKFHLFFFFFSSSGSIFLVHILYITVWTKRGKVRHCWDHQYFEFVATFFPMVHVVWSHMRHDAGTFVWGALRQAVHFISFHFTFFRSLQTCIAFARPLRVEYRTAAGIETNACIFRYVLIAFQCVTLEYRPIFRLYLFIVSHTPKHNGIDLLCGMGFMHGGVFRSFVPKFFVMTQWWYEWPRSQLWPLT